MSKTTSIGWCDSTSNMVIGCSKVSDGCKNCYAMMDTPARVLRHRGIETWGLKGVRHSVESFERNMIAMNRKPLICDRCGDASEIAPDGIGKQVCNTCLVGPLRRRRIFADSNSDWLDENWPIATFAKFLDVLRRCDQCVIQLLTKRPENFDNRIRLARNYETTRNADNALWLNDWLNKSESAGMPARPGNPPKHIWIGTSVENQAMADKRIPALIKIPADVRFLSCEPLLGPITNIPRTRLDHDKQVVIPGIDWVIVGGESGSNQRQMDVSWLKSIVDECKAFWVPCVYVKQDNGQKSGQQGRIPEDYWHVKEFPRV